MHGLRVFSHTCSNTEIVCALGAGAQLIGVDADSDYPPEVVRALPRPGRDLDLDVEAVLRLAPDLILTSLTVPGHERIVEAFERSGRRVLTLDPQSLDGVYASIHAIAAALDRADRGADLVAQMRAAMPPVAVEGERPRVLVEWWPKPVIVPARDSWVTDLIALAGGRNPCAGIEAKSVVLADGDDAAMADIVVMSWCGVPQQNYRAEVVLRRPSWQHWPALRGRRVHAITEAWLGRPGPRLVEGYRALRQLIESR